MAFKVSRDALQKQSSTREMNWSFHGEGASDGSDRSRGPPGRGGLSSLIPPVVAATYDSRDDFIEDPNLDLAPLWERVARAFLLLLHAYLVSWHDAAGEAEIEGRDAGNWETKHGII